MKISELKKELLDKLIDASDLENTMLQYGYQLHQVSNEGNIVYSNENDMLRIFVKVVIQPDVYIILNMEYC